MILYLTPEQIAAIYRSAIEPTPDCTRVALTRDIPPDSVRVRYDLIDGTFTAVTLLPNGRPLGPEMSGPEVPS